MNQLYQLARLYNLQTAYTDGMGHRRQASPESILQVLRAMGVPAGSMEDLSGAISQRYHTLWGRCIEPVVVAWEGQPVKLVLRLSKASAKDSISLKLNLETGEVREWTFQTSRLTNATVPQGKVAGTVAKCVTLPGKLPWGYHRLTVEVAEKSHRSLVISAPVKAYSESPKQGEKKWGVFLPLYALRSNRSWGSGDFTDLLALSTWVKGLGGGVVGTLPLLATFLDEPFDPSPYSPASRLFWNEFYLDVMRIPELESCPEARDLIASADFQKEVETHRLTERVDYRSQMRMKRKVMEKLVRVFFKESSERKSAFDRYLQSHPAVEQYAQFRATCEKQRSPWPTWSQRLRDGHLEPGDYDEEDKQYHLYAQWLADQQLGASARGSSASGPELYLDLPLGVHPHGYDVWSERDLFALEVSVGAPPDSFFTGGQDWGVPPLQPEPIREQGYRYPIAVIQHHLKYAGFLRIDHVMGLHRLFWIPKGMKPQHGVYARYNAEELYAILSLESHKHRATLIGENLGTVPASINSAMSRHNIQRMYVVQYELHPNSHTALRTASPNSLASMNTHDMRPFGSFWEGLDIQDRVQLGLLNEEGSRVEHKKRSKLQQALTKFLRSRGWLHNHATNLQVLLRACLSYLSASPARLLLINLEDLWLERDSQNLPGSGDECANWKKKARYSFEEFCQMPRVMEVLREVDQIRRRRT